MNLTICSKETAFVGDELSIEIIKMAHLQQYKVNSFHGVISPGGIGNTLICLIWQI